MLPLPLPGFSYRIPVVLIFLLLPSRFSMDAAPSEYQETLFPAGYPKEFLLVGIWDEPRDPSGPAPPQSGGIFHSRLFQGSQNASSGSFPTLGNIPAASGPVRNLWNSGSGGKRGDLGSSRQRGWENPSSSHSRGKRLHPIRHPAIPKDPSHIKPSHSSKIFHRERGTIPVSC